MIVHNHITFPLIVTEIECDFYRYIRDDLIDWIYKYQSTAETVHLTNRGGWQSPSDFYQQETFSEFKSYILNNAFQSLTHYNRRFELSNMWININKKGNYNTAHNHPGCIMSGVFWVKAPENCGNLRFLSPHSFAECFLLQSFQDDDVRKKVNYSESMDFMPKDGVMILFPSHLQHLVESNESDEDRISIAFNLS